MKYINIFLASITDDLSLERLQLGNYVRVLNGVLEKNDIKLKLVTSEEELDEEIDDSDYFIIMFYKDSDPLMLEEFERAYNHFKKASKPNIFTYFKACDNPETEIKSFMQRLDQQLSHYYTVFDHIDTIKLKLLLSLSAKCDMRENIEYKDGNVLLQGTKLEELDLNNIPAYFNSNKLKELNKKLSVLNQDLVKAKLAFINNVDDEKLEAKYLELSNKCNDVKKDLHKYEQDLYKVTSSVVEISNGLVLSEKAKAAIKLLNEGKPEMVLKLLNAEDRQKDAQSLKVKLESAKKAIAQEFEVLVNETMLEINAYMMQGVNDDNIPCIINLYEEIKTYVLENDLDYAPIYKYACFLNDISHFNEAEKNIRIVIDNYQKKAKVYELFVAYMGLFEIVSASNDSLKADKVLEEIKGLANAHQDFFNNNLYLSVRFNKLCATSAFIAQNYNEALGYAEKNIKLLSKYKPSAWILKYQNNAMEIKINVWEAQGKYEDANKLIDALLHNMEGHNWFDYDEEEKNDLAFRLYITKAIGIMNLANDNGFEDAFDKARSYGNKLITSNPKLYKNYALFLHCFNSLVDVTTAKTVSKKEIKKIVDEVLELNDEELNSNIAVIYLLPSILNLTGGLDFLLNNKIKKLIERYKVVSPSRAYMAILNDLMGKIYTETEKGSESQKLLKLIAEFNENYEIAQKYCNKLALINLAMHTYSSIAFGENLSFAHEYKLKASDLYYAIKNDKPINTLVLFDALFIFYDLYDEDANYANDFVDIYFALKEKDYFKNNPDVLDDIDYGLISALTKLANDISDHKKALDYLLEAISLQMQFSKKDIKAINNNIVAFTKHLLKLDDQHMQYYGKLNAIIKKDKFDYSFDETFKKQLFLAAYKDETITKTNNQQYSDLALLVSSSKDAYLDVNIRKQVIKLNLACLRYYAERKNYYKFHELLMATNNVNFHIMKAFNSITEAKSYWLELKAIAEMVKNEKDCLYVDKAEIYNTLSLIGFIYVIEPKETFAIMGLFAYNALMVNQDKYNLTVCQAAKHLINFYHKNVEKDQDEYILSMAGILFGNLALAATRQANHELRLTCANEAVNVYKVLVKKDSKYQTKLDKALKNLKDAEASHD